MNSPDGPSVVPWGGDPHPSVSTPIDVPFRVPPPCHALTDVSTCCTGVPDLGNQKWADTSREAYTDAGLPFPA